jgi:hypothetical protein
MSIDGTYEIVVAGQLGPLLRSMLTDLDIEDRPAQTCVHSDNADAALLFSLLAVMVNDEHPLERLVIETGPAAS